MKKLLFILTFFFLTFPAAIICQGQVLSLDSVIGFPDTVQDNQQVTMTFRLSTNGTAFVGDLAILMNSTQHDSTPDTLYYNINDSIGGNGFIDSLVVPYTFRASDLDGGDNIVVVWPASSQASVNSDSLQFHVVLINVGIAEVHDAQSVKLFQNPSSDFISLLITHPEKVEQVRVLDVIGNIVMTFDHPVTQFPVLSLSSGIYFAEVNNKDGSHIIRKFFRH